MKQGHFTIVENVQIADRTWRMRLAGDTSALLRGGQFVDVALEGKFLRRPFAAAWWTDSEMAVIYKTAGDGTEEMSRLKAGADLDILTGLGNGFDAGLCRNKALVVCGGLGASPAFTLVKELRSQGKEVAVVLGFNKASEMVLEDEYRRLGADVTIVTADGSAGVRGFVTDALAGIGKDFDVFYTCGPKVMMKAVCGMLEGPGQASLEERMGCGIGLCYGCTCHTTQGPKRICADGPVFNREDIIW